MSMLSFFIIFLCEVSRLFSGLVKIKYVLTYFTCLVAAADEEHGDKTTLCFCAKM